MKFVIPKLDIHVADACNLHCEQCDHFSNYKFSKIFDLETLRSWCEPWSRKLYPQSLHILGGEPLMNPNISDVLYLMREIWNGSNIILWSNGLLAKNHPELPKALEKTGIRLHISNHTTENSVVYDRKFEECLEVLKEWFVNHSLNITVQYNNGMHSDFTLQSGKCIIINHQVNIGGEKTLWEKFYHGYGKNMKPYDDKDSKLSWTNCTAKCPQLYNGKIHKCAPLTFLPLMHQKFCLSEEWSHYLTYKGLSPDCTDDQLSTFLSLQHESYCGMCPTKRPKFKSYHDPLKVEQKEQFK